MDDPICECIFIDVLGPGYPLYQMFMPGCPMHDEEPEEDPLMPEEEEMAPEDLEYDKAEERREFNRDQVLTEAWEGMVPGDNDVREVSPREQRYGGVDEGG